MIIPCPVCGPRDAREFVCQGSAARLARPAPDAGEEVWDDYLHNRENVAGVVDELWYHRDGCGSWLIVTRNTITHEVLGARLASEEVRDAG
ncbi:MAG: sarcosine oxidase subunit delta [Pseudomonadota bacterium]